MTGGNLDLSVCRDLQQAVPGSAITKRCRTDFASVVVPIDKLSILVTIAFSYLVFHEKSD